MNSDQPNIYQSLNSEADHAIALWSFYANERCNDRVVPDGCCDIIVKNHRDRGSPRWFISELSAATYDVVSNPGDEMLGIRLEPGVQIDQLALNEWTKSHSVRDLFIADQVDEFCQRSLMLSEALQCLSSEEIDSVQEAARHLGVSHRTLQRLVKNETQRPPYFWFSLARMRRTAKSLYKFDRMAEAAAAFHFSDQAHMTRDLKQWLGMTPNQIKRDAELHSQLNEPGYA